MSRNSSRECRNRCHSEAQPKNLVFASEILRFAQDDTRGKRTRYNFVADMRGYALVYMTRYQGYNMVMKKVSISSAKTNLSRYLGMVEKGESVLLCRRNVPVAEISPVFKPGKTPRPIGLAKGKFKMHPGFDKPLPHKLEKLFSGESE